MPAPECLFATLAGASTVLIAVSGGPDSIALLHLLARWRPAGGLPALVAATVDHGLRPESGAEAALVAEASARLGIPHRVLAWQGPKPAAGLQAAARAARYTLLLEEARRLGATHLATAHTLDDQAETVLMRLARGSGLAGLAGMRRDRDRGGIRHVRPLLGCRKTDLLALCRREGWRFVEDPSNWDERFARPRWRKRLPDLAEEGLTPERLARFAERARSAEEALSAKAEEALERARAGRSPGADHVSATFLRDEPFAIGVRVLALLLREGRSEADPLRLQRLERAAERLRAAFAGGEVLRLTLAGRVLDLDARGNLRVRPEPQRRRGRYQSVSDDDAGRPPSLGKEGGHA